MVAEGGSGVLSEEPIVQSGNRFWGIQSRSHNPTLGTRRLHVWLPGVHLGVLWPQPDVFFYYSYVGSPNNYR